MKYLLLLILFGTLVLLLYWRLRPYIRAVRRVLGVVREAHRMNTPPQSADLPRRERRTGAAGQKLLRCAACGTWTPAASAVTLRATGVSYCSHACLERAADAPQRSRKSAS